MSAWEVFPHGELKQVADRLWCVTGSLPRSPVPRNMFVYRLDDGGLLIFSAVAMDEPKMQQLEALGQPRVILVPNHFHRMQAAAYLERYPEARVVCPAAARTHVAKAVTVHATAEEDLPGRGVICHAPAGVKETERVYEVPIEGGAALLFCDMLFNLKQPPGLGGFFIRLIGSSGFFGVTRIGRLFLLSDKRAAKGWLGGQTQRDDVALIGVAHGDVIMERCKERLAEAAARL